MAFVAGVRDNGTATSRFLDENKAMESKAAKAVRVVGPSQGGTVRRVLGEIGNFTRVNQAQLAKRNAKGGADTAAGQRAVGLLSRHGDGGINHRVIEGPSLASKPGMPIVSTTDASASIAQVEPLQPSVVLPRWGATRSRHYGIQAYRQGQTGSAAGLLYPTGGVSTRQDAATGRSMSSLLAARSAEACRGASSSGSVEEEEPCTNIDFNDRGDVRQVVDYVEDIYDFYRRAEIQSAVQSDYMKIQPDINAKMRAILIDWLVEVHMKFELLPETLYLTTNLIDRYLAKKVTTRKNLQLVGITAMMIACKYEEIYAPEVRDFVFICDRAYSRAAILDMEKKMLNTLNFNLTVPTPYVFMVRFLKAGEADKRMEQLANFLVELALLEYSMMKFSPSQIAAAAVYTAMRTLGRVCPGWNWTMRRHSGYTAEALEECASIIAKCHKNARSTSLVAVPDKYSTLKFLEVAKISPCLELITSPIIID
ncbi:hypothetical protein CBR_g48126 [Chara braunii]|uniref:Cyclin N-terminal domain-containing protein n=1 Tax=Chara braunii TaxID=69332 RepID=A0A388M232_CHABU|nr:hypothetical protein CBR_g48126 [Chara braunii]|eukprot:GBG88596.1 hypothetical protein CBR_g48126 [Chara braunii]